MCTLRNGEANISRAQPFIYLAPRPRAGCAFSPISTDFTPNFQLARPPPLRPPPPPADLHNILEILYKISLLYLPILLRRRLSACTRYCSASTVPFATTDARWVKRVDHEESNAQKKFVKHREIREIRVDAT